MIRVALGGLRLIVIAVIAAVLMGAGILAIAPPRYEATVNVLVDVGLPEDASANAIRREITYANYRTITIKALITTDLILDPVIRDLSLDTTPRELAADVTALSALDTSIVEIIVVSDDATESADIANAIARQAIDEVSQANAEVSLDLTVVQAATAPTARSGPHPSIVLGLSAIAGVFLALAYLFARHSLFPRLRDVEDVVAVYEKPVLGTLKKTQKGRAASEPSLESIATTLATVSASRHWRNIVMVSPTVRDELDSLVTSLRSEIDRIGRPDVNLLKSDASPARREAILVDAEIDAVIIVVPLGQTLVAELATAVDHLALCGVELSGYIVTDLPRGRNGSTGFTTTRQ